MTQFLLILVALAVAVALALLAGLRSSLLQLGERLTVLSRDQEKAERAVREEAAQGRTEEAAHAKQAREELSGSLKQFSDFLLSRMTEIATLQRSQLDTFSTQLTTLTQSNEAKLDKLRETVEAQLKALQEDNSQKLEQMRATVDEKLHATLEQRLGESFKLVSERLELVHKGLGEMQTLATGVGDLKKVLSGVKTRGTWGEVQLGALLEQVLSPEQYETNVATKKGSAERVEYALKLPGQEKGQEVWVPIDAKFPQEDYQRLLDAQEAADAEAAARAAGQLELRLKAEAKDISEKYINVPFTTNFALMFLPTEGLFAEVIRRPGLTDHLQQEYRVMVTGPTTLAALLNSLQMGFRTLAIQKRTDEVWQLLGAVKSEFGKFGDLLDKTHQKLEQATNAIESARTKSRTIERKLKKVQEPLAAGEGPQLSLVESLGGSLDDGEAGEDA